jgi:hypothetical protein
MGKILSDNELARLIRDTVTALEVSTPMVADITVEELRNVEGMPLADGYLGYPESFFENNPRRIMEWYAVQLISIACHKESWGAMNSILNGVHKFVPQVTL